MIVFTFEVPGVGSPWRATWDMVDNVVSAEISEMDLRYKYFGVRALLVVDEVEIISDSGHVTLVDLALSVRHALGRLALGEEASLGFTESADVIRLVRDGDLVLVSTSVDGLSASIDYVELVTSFSEFLQKAYTCLVSRAPGLARNLTIRKVNPT